MNTLLVMPSRGRPAQAVLAARSAMETSSANVRIVIIVDADDPSLDAYTGIPGSVADVLVLNPASNNMVEAANRGLREFVEQNGDYDIYGFIADDVRFHTLDWETKIADRLEHPGIAYGDDGLQHEALATHWFVSGRIVKALGGICLAPTHHFYQDNAWMELGKEVGILKYMPDVSIEHLHFSAGKSRYDDTYERSDQWWKSGEDSRLYAEWRNSPAWDALVRRTKAAIRP